MTERIVSGAQQQEDVVAESLRPSTFDEYVGQERVKEQLRVFIAAARARREALDHVLLYGPPGLGKTTLATIVAREMGVNLRVTSGPAIERQGDMAAILTSLADGDVLFVDEIHRLAHSIEEILYPAMEDGALDLVIGKGAGARSLRLDLPRFTLVGATTRPGLLSSPLRDRFGMLLRLEFYPPQDLAEIVRRAARILGTPIEPEAVEQLSRRSRGTPRIANRLLRRLRDVAEVRADGVVTGLVAQEGLKLLEVDEYGLDSGDRRLLTLMAKQYDGGPVGLETLAASLSEDMATIEDVYEPYLMQMGFLERTPRGRQLAPGGWRYLGMASPNRLFVEG